MVAWGQGWGQVDVVIERQHRILVPMELIYVLTGGGNKKPTHMIRLHKHIHKLVHVKPKKSE